MILPFVTQRRALLWNSEKRFCAAKATSRQLSSAHFAVTACQGTAIPWRHASGCCLFPVSGWI